VLEINDNFFTTSINLLIGSYPILFRTSLSILTNCVCLNRSSGGGNTGDGLMVLFGAFIG
jgi:hypothetical protein